MDRPKLNKKIASLIRDAGPAEIFIALSAVMSRQIDESAPPSDSGDVEDAIDSVPELRAWNDFVGGPLEKAMKKAIQLEDDAGYPPADQRMSPKNRGLGGTIEAIFPWLRK